MSTKHKCIDCVNASTWGNFINKESIASEDEYKAAKFFLRMIENKLCCIEKFKTMPISKETYCKKFCKSEDKEQFGCFKRLQQSAITETKTKIKEYEKRYKK